MSVVGYTEQGMIACTEGTCNFEFVIRGAPCVVLGEVG